MTNRCEGSARCAGQGLSEAPAPTATCEVCQRPVRLLLSTVKGLWSAHVPTHATHLEPRRKRSAQP